MPPKRKTPHHQVSQNDDSDDDNNRNVTQSLKPLNQTSTTSTTTSTKRQRPNATTMQQDEVEIFPNLTATNFQSKITELMTDEVKNDQLKLSEIILTIQQVQQEQIELPDLQRYCLNQHKEGFKQLFTSAITTINPDLNQDIQTQFVDAVFQHYHNPAQLILTLIAVQQSYISYFKSFFSTPPPTTMVNSLTLPEAINLISKIYPTNINNISLLHAIHGATYENPTVVGQDNHVYKPLYNRAIQQYLPTSITDPQTITNHIVDIIMNYDSAHRGSLIRQLRACLHTHNADIRLTDILNLVNPNDAKEITQKIQSSLSASGLPFYYSISSYFNHNQYCSNHELDVSYPTTFSKLISSIFKDSSRSVITFESIRPLLIGEYQSLRQLFTTHQTPIQSFIIDPTNEELQGLSQIFQQSPMYISQTSTSTSVEVTGRSAQQGNKEIQSPPLFQIPTFQTVQPLQSYELFSTPQRSILFFGTLAQTLLHHRIGLLCNELSSEEIKEQLTTWPQIIQLANDLSIPIQDFVEFILMCRSLIFLHHTTRECNVIVARSGLGKSFLYVFLCAIYHHLQIPFSYVVHQKVLARKMSKNDSVTSPYHNLIYTPNQHHQYFYFKSSSIQTHIELIQPKSILLFDCQDNQYELGKWDELIKQLTDSLKKKYSYGFSFSSATKKLAIPLDGKKDEQDTLAQYGIYPYYFSPSKANYLLGMVQLHFYRYLQQQLQSFLALDSDQRDVYLKQKKTIKQFHTYFGPALLQSTQQFNTDFYWFIKNYPPNTVISPRLLQEIATQFINNHQYESFFQQIISHPTIDFLLPKQASPIQYETHPNQSSIFQLICDQVDPTSNSPHISVVPAFYSCHRDYRPDIQHQQPSLSTIQESWPNFTRFLSDPTNTSTSTQFQLLSQIHRLWYDLSIYECHGEPSTRLYHFLSSYPPNNNKPPYNTVTCHLLGSVFHKQSIKLFIHPTVIELDLPENETKRRLIQDAQSVTTSPIPQSTSFGFEINFINSLLQSLDRFECYLPFPGFCHLPIRQITSFNNFFNVQLHPSQYYKYRPKLDPNTNVQTDFHLFLVSLIQQKRPDNHSIHIIVPPNCYEGVDIFALKPYQETITTGRNRVTTIVQKFALLGIQLTSGTQSTPHSVKLPPFVSDCEDDVTNSNTTFSYAFVTTLYKPITPAHNIEYFQFISPQLILNPPSQQHIGDSFLLSPDHSAFR